jgi:hypothetical protein
MEVCKLCLQNEATRTNSHILPHSLIRRAVNLDASRYRDREFVFNFSNNAAPSRFQGRNVIPTSLENLELSIDNIEVTEHNSTTEDYIFCNDCEDKFGRIEGYFSEKIIMPFQQSQIFTSNSRTTISLRQSDHRLLRLYVYGLFWRVSISQTYDFHLLPEEEEMMREWLNSGMDLNLHAVRSNLDGIPDFCDLPLSIAYAEELDDPSQSFIDANVFSRRPYMLIVGTFSFFLYFKKRHMKSLLNNFYGLSQFVDKVNVYNIQESQIEFLKIFKGEYERVFMNAVDFVTSEHLNFFLKKFVFIHRQIFGTKPILNDLLLFRRDFGEMGVDVNEAMRLQLMQAHFERIFRRRSRL